jgi:hypothetical protein
MATKRYCDLCDNEAHDLVVVEMRDGEHPHNGSTMYKDVDICMNCIRKVKKLYSAMEYDDAVSLCKQ